MTQLHRAEVRVVAASALSVRERRVLGWREPRREGHRAQRRYGREVVRAEIDGLGNIDQCDGCEACSPGHDLRRTSDDPGARWRA